MIRALLIFLMAVPAWAGESEDFHKLLKEDWQNRMEMFPEFATYVGFPGHNGKWTDMSMAALKERQAYDKDLLEKLQDVDRKRLSDEDKLNLDLATWEIEQDVRSAAFPEEYLVINQLGGVHISPMNTIQANPTRTANDLKDVVARIKGVKKLVEQNIALMRAGLKANVTPPKIALRNVGDEMMESLSVKAEDHPLMKPFSKKSDLVSKADYEKYKSQALAAVKNDVLPAYKKLHEFFTKEYYPNCTEKIGLTSLPKGKEWYQYRIERRTTTKLKPQEIHQLGLSEVKRIRGLMEKTKQEAKFKGSLADFQKFLKNDKQFFFTKKEDLLTAYRAIGKRADYELIKMFGHLPRLPYGVKAIPSYQEKSSATAFYRGGSIEAGRAGAFYANTYNLKSRPKWEMEALTLHEAVPGHHLQISIANEMENVPEFRKHGGHTAYIEGWGLYAESLGYEMGFYTDPYSKYGALSYEMWRAVRLVVDTGMHSLGWSRQKAIDFFKENSGKPEHDITVEVDRYIVWPGQALAYKIGELKIKELRKYAENRLGSKFDIRGFHDEVLGAGSLPLGVLEKRIKNWVGRQQSQNAERDESKTKQAG